MPPRYSREIEQPIVMGDSLKDQFRTSPCEASCPAGNPIQKMQSLVEKGRFGEALRYLRARNPFPGVTGRVRARSGRKLKKITESFGLIVATGLPSFSTTVGTTNSSVTSAA